MSDDHGIYTKYFIERLDGTDQEGGKHYQCPCFVLDLKHDQYARAAAKFYAFLCADEKPLLSSDLWSLLKVQEEIDESN